MFQYALPAKLLFIQSPSTAQIIFDIQVIQCPTNTTKPYPDCIKISTLYVQLSQITVHLNTIFLSLLSAHTVVTRIQKVIFDIQVIQSPINVIVQLPDRDKFERVMLSAK